MENALNKRIARNTIFLYIRMLIIMFVSLFTSRIVLNRLGVEDYGIHNVIAGVISMFAFMNNSLSMATQRFLNFGLGKKEDNQQITKIFNICFITFLILSILILFLGELIGYSFVKGSLKISPNRIDVALIIFHISIFTFIVNIIQIPFNAVVISHEKMSIFAYFSIVETILKLIIAFAITYTPFDRLISYSSLLLTNSIVILLMYVTYCRINFKECQDLYFVRDLSLFKEIIKFSGWTFLGSSASIASNQGLNILFNTFFGVTLNTAYGISSQISHAVNSFITNFQTAFRPSIIKTYANNQKENLYMLICNTSLFSFFLIFILSFPLMLNINYILNLWLGNKFPVQTPLFCIFFFLHNWIEVISAPLWMTIQASGNIKYYQLSVSFTLILNIIISYILLKNGYSAYYAFILKILLDTICYSIRLYFTKLYIRLNLIDYSKRVFLKIILFILFNLIIIYPIVNNFDELRRLSYSILLTFFITLPSALFLLDKDQKNSLKQLITQKLIKKEYK